MDSVRKRFRTGAVILLYHRVTNLKHDPQMLAVSPKHFAEHLQFLRSHARPVSLRHLSDRSNDDSRKAVGITFDDGYADNLHEAKPLLEEYEAPATVFVSTGYLDANREFWWDELENIFMNGRVLPDTLEIRLKGSPRRWPSRDAYVGLCAAIRALPPDDRETVLDEVRAWAKKKAVCRDSHRPMTKNEVRQLDKGSVVEVGSHTVAHPVLSSLNADAQRDQIRRDKTTLENLLGRQVRSFAYPFGNRPDYNRASVNAVREAGFEIACSNFEGIVWPRTDRLELPRMLVRNWSGDEFARRFEAWFS